MLRGHWRGSITKHIVIQSGISNQFNFWHFFDQLLALLFRQTIQKRKILKTKNFCCKYLKWQAGSEKSSHPIQVISYPSNSFSDLCFKHLANFAVHNVHFIQRQYQTSWYRKCKDKYKYSNVWNKLILHGTLFTSKYYQKYEYASIMSFIFTNQALRHGLPVSLSFRLSVPLSSCLSVILEVDQSEACLDD